MIYQEGEVLPMMSNEGYRDRVLTCRDCGNEFTFTAGEQEFYASKGLTNSPSRCPGCRAARRGQQPSAPRAPRGEQYDAICATCGRPTSVPFMPREDRPVYCSDCFQAQRASRPHRDDSRNYSMSYSPSNDGGNYGGGNTSGNYGGGNSGGNYGGGRDRRSGGRDSRDRRESGKRDRRESRWDDRW